MKKNLFKAIIIVVSICLLSGGSFSFGFYSAWNRGAVFDSIRVISRVVYRKYFGFKERLMDMLGRLGEENKGRFSKMSHELHMNSVDYLKDLSALDALPYLQGVVPVPKVSGVTVYKADKVYLGLNFMVSGHKPYACLMDMEGNIIHEWSYPFEKAWPEGIEFYVPPVNKSYWRRAQLFDNGDILAIFEGIGMIKLDKESDLIWTSKCRAHHDIFVHENGNIYTLTRHRTDPDYESEYDIELEGKVVEDFIAILSPEGEVLREISIYKCFLNSYYAPALQAGPKWGDFFHTNTIEVLEDSHEDKIPMFRAGHILVSIRENSIIAIINPDSEKVTWMMYGYWHRQHEPIILENGNVLIFDNKGLHHLSKVVEFNPLTQQLVWEFRGTKENYFFSPTSGANQRLPNDNTLITETDMGRAFEVTRDKEIVWKYYNPFRAGEDNQLIARLFEVIRIEREALNCVGNRNIKCFQDKGSSLEPKPVP